MRQEINKTENQELSLVVQAIGTDLEHTQVCMITSANADMLFHYWKVGHFILYLQKKEGWEAKLSTIYPRLYAHNIPTRKGIPPATLSICASSQRLILWRF